jgi:hypothetical protein
MKTHTGKGPDETKEPAGGMTEMADMLRKNCEEALRTSLKFQEETGRWWSTVFNPAVCAEQWQGQFNTATRAANSFLPLAQKPLSELMNLAEKNSRTSVDLMKQALEAAQAPAVADSQAKWTEFWTSSLGAARAHTEAVAQISSKAIDSWAELVRRTA